MFSKKSSGLSLSCSSHFVVWLMSASSFAGDFVSPSKKAFPNSVITISFLLNSIYFVFSSFGMNVCLVAAVPSPTILMKHLF